MSHTQHVTHDVYYPLARERVGVWFACLPEMQAVLSAADQWTELVDMLHAHGWRNVTPALVASLAPKVTAEPPI